jgi:hypothetical protein
MPDPEQIRRFTRSVAMMKDPPWLPIAAWVAVVPALAQFDLIAAPWWLGLLAVAAVATALGSRRFKRTYGVVTPSPGSFSGYRMSAGGVVGLTVVVLGLELLAAAIGLPIDLGFAAFGAWLAWGARASDGVRSHLYVLAAICIGLAFVPLVANLADHRSLGNSMRATIFTSAFGVGWVYVCIQDYRAIRKNLRQAQG